MGGIGVLVGVDEGLVGGGVEVLVGVGVVVLVGVGVEVLVAVGIAVKVFAIAPSIVSGAGVHPNNMKAIANIEIIVFMVFKISIIQFVGRVENPPNCKKVVSISETT